MTNKLVLDIEISANKRYIVTRYKTNPNSIQRLVGTPVEKETLIFTTTKELVDWIEKQGG
jgi:hypothetical protein